MTAPRFVSIASHPFVYLLFHFLCLTSDSLLGVGLLQIWNEILDKQSKIYRKSLLI